MGQRCSSGKITVQARLFLIIRQELQAEVSDAMADLEEKGVAQQYFTGDTLPIIRRTKVREEYPVEQKGTFIIPKYT